MELRSGFTGIYKKEKGEKASYFDLLRCIESRSSHVVIVFAIDIPGSFFFQLVSLLLLAGCQPFLGRIESRGSQVILIFAIDIPGSFFFQLLGCLLLAGS